jgi:hypothetical protein
MPKATKLKLRSSDLEDDVGPPEASSRPLSEITGRRDEGSGANETVDGLDEYQEAARHGAEDIPAAEKRKTLRDVPVFDRADIEPKV